MNPSLVPEIGPDGLAREAPVIAYTEKVLLLSLCLPISLLSRSSIFGRAMDVDAIVPSPWTFLTDNRGRTASIEEVILFLCVSLL